MAVNRIDRPDFRIASNQSLLKILPSVISGRYYDRIVFCRQNCILSTEYNSVQKKLYSDDRIVKYQQNSRCYPNSISILGKHRQGAADFHIAVQRRPIVGFWAGVGGKII